jgi:hypothetical protein
MQEPSFQVSLTQRFFASNWLLRVWLVAFSLGFPLTVLGWLNLKMMFAVGGHVWLLVVGVSSLFAFAGFLTGVVLFSAFIGPLLELRTRLNGGPFAVGDTVVVLGGKYRGRRGLVDRVGQGAVVSVKFDEKEEPGFEIYQHQLHLQ